jgi:diacylglycerol O-acyltransferase / wax synthase
MAPRHLDRLSALDASFLHQEGPETHMHIGALAVVDGPPPGLDELLATIGSRLHRVPRYRQRLAHTPFDRGRPVWIDDPGFRLEFHVRRAALPAPGGHEQLLAMLAQIFSAQLDRRRPLWELWFIEGLHDDRFALIFKAHHAVTDGVAGVDLATVVLDPEGEHDERAPDWTPARSPGAAELAALAATRDAQAALTLLGHALAAAIRPQQAAARLRAALDGVGEVVRATLDPAPATPLNVPIGPYRRFVTVSCRLEDIRAISERFGGTVNDVVLAVVSGALRRFLDLRDVRTAGLELRALVPVSLRVASDGAGAAGNRVAALRAPLPVAIADPLARLAAVSAAMIELKGSRQALGTEVLVGLQDFAPPAILAQAARLSFATRLFNLLVTNVPGPRAPLHVLGREIREVYPVALLPRDHALSVAVLSYNERLNFGLLADYDTLPELEQIGDWVSAEIDALLGLLQPAA